MRSLRYKILAVATALVLLSQAGTVMTVLVTANRDVAERARQRLETGRRLFEQTLQARTSQLANTVRVLSADYAFKQAVASHDIDTIASALTNHARRAGTGIAYLMDEDGSIVATSETAVTAKRRQSELVRLANANGVAHSVTVHEGRAYEFITVPVRAPLPIGWVSMGFALDDAYMHQIEKLTGLQASLISSTTGTPVVVASPLGAPIRKSLAAASRKVDRGQTSTANIAGSDFLILTQPLPPEYGELAVVLTASLTEAMAPYRLLRTAAFFLGTLPVLLALIAAALLSRALTRPVQQLAEAARRMKVGDYSQQVSVTTGDELAELALTFNTMQDDIASREARITHQASHDSLTGLHNRDFALKQVDTCIATAAQEGGHVAVMVLSLNGCTDIATSLGHDITDSYVRQAAEQLQEQVEHRFMLARLETDDFLLVMPGLDALRAADVAEHLLKSLEPGIGLPNVTVHARPMAGIAVYPDHGETHDQLLLRATIARPGTGDGATVGLYHRGEEDRRVRRLTIISTLRRAVYHEEFKLFYQPKIALADGSVCGAEALLRWNHPTLGPLSPAEFIPVAEQSGNISMLTRWALKAAVRECRYWQEQGLDIPVSVNLSASDLMDKELPSFVMSVLRNHDMDPRFLVAEITEEGLVRDFDNAALLLQRLRDLGIRISIDDFGTGYSSLAQIRNLPVDELKLDKSFVTRLPDDRADAAIVKASIDLAHNLGMEFVAEGVETQLALNWLREHGCERIQGFFISAPLPADAFISWVSNYENGSAMRMPALKAG